MLTVEKSNNESKDKREEKIISYLNTLEKHFTTEKNPNLYQERFHRINKALMSIKQHSNCYVSDFSIQEKETKNLEESISDEEMKAPQEEKDKEVDELLKYIEKELSISSKKEKGDPNSLTPVKENKDEKRLSKIFLKIELKLKTHLEQQEACKSNSTQGRRSLFNKRSSILPKLIKNFFEEKDKVKNQVTEQMNKRRSLYTGGNIGSSFRNGEKADFNPIHSGKKHLSFSEKQEFAPVDKKKKSVTRFDIANLVQNKDENEDDNQDIYDDIEYEDVEMCEDDNQMSPTTTNYFEQFKRSSIIRDSGKMNGYMNQIQEVDEN